MTTFADEILDQLQAVAIAHGTLRTSDKALAEVVANALDAPERVAEIRRHLHSMPLRTALHARDVLLFFGFDGLVRLVDAQPVSDKAARLRVAHQPGPDTCRFCLMTEKRSLQPELMPELDDRGQRVPGSFLHEACMPAWNRLRQQATRKQA